MDAVVHLANIPAPGICPPARTFNANTAMNSNVFLAAAALGLAGWSGRPARPRWACRSTPRPATRRSTRTITRADHHLRAVQGGRRDARPSHVASWSGIPFVGLRLSNILEPHEYARFPGSGRRQTASVEPVGLHRCPGRRPGVPAAPEAPTTGAVNVIIAAADNVMDRPSLELIRRSFRTWRCGRGVRSSGRCWRSTGPVAVLGFGPEHSWRTRRASGLTPAVLRNDPGALRNDPGHDLLDRRRGRWGARSRSATEHMAGADQGRGQRVDVGAGQARRPRPRSAARCPRSCPPPPSGRVRRPARRAQAGAQLVAEDDQADDRQATEPNSRSARRPGCRRRSRCRRRPAGRGLAPTRARGLGRIRPGSRRSRRSAGAGRPWRTPASAVTARLVSALGPSPRSIRSAASNNCSRGSRMATPVGTGPPSPCTPVGEWACAHYRGRMTTIPCGPCRPHQQLAGGGVVRRRRRALRPGPAALPRGADRPDRLRPPRPRRPGRRLWHRHRRPAVPGRGLHRPRGRSRRADGRRCPAARDRGRGGDLRDLGPGRPGLRRGRRRQSWHWVDPVAGAAMAARVLRPGGRLAPFWHVFQPPPERRGGLRRGLPPGLPDSPFDLGPSTKRSWTPTSRCSPRPPRIRAAGGFEEPEEWSFDWERATPARMAGPDPHPARLTRLPPEQLAAVLDGVGAAIDALGGRFTMPYATVAVTASR